MLQKLKKLFRDEEGQTIVEFAIVFPLQLFVTLGILQWALLYVGQEVVAYAAFCAARAEIAGEDPARAAQIACIPISGTSVDGDIATLPELSTPAGNPDRAKASVVKTNANVIAPRGSGIVTVQVSHNFELIVPVVNYFPFSAVTYFGEPGNEVGGEPHTLIVEQCSLVEP